MSVIVIHCSPENLTLWGWLTYASYSSFHSHSPQSLHYTTFARLSKSLFGYYFNQKETQHTSCLVKIKKFDWIYLTLKLSFEVCFYTSLTKIKNRKYMAHFGRWHFLKMVTGEVRAPEPGDWGNQSEPVSLCEKRQNI